MTLTLPSPSRSQSISSSTISRWSGWFGLRGVAAWLFACTAACQTTPDDSPSPPAPLCETSAPAAAEARLLTRSEYLRTVRDLLQTDSDPTTDFPPEPLVHGFSNSASSHQVNPLLVEKYFKSARQLAEEVGRMGVRRLHACDASLSSDECASEFLDHFGLRAYRRPLLPEEKQALLGLYSDQSSRVGHDDALVAVIEVMLQSPQFLYRVEAPVARAHDGAVPLGAYELASRLSYFIQGTLPDAELLEAAAADELRTPSQVEEQARRLLADPKAHSRVREFHAAWLGLDRLDSVARNDAPEGFAASLRESVLRFTDDVFHSDASSVEELYSSSRVTVDSTLAPVLGLPSPEPDTWVTHDLSGQRSGILTQPAVMSLLSHANQSSPIQRGVFIREHVFCQPVEPPPPSVNNNPPDPQPGLTTRELFEVHTASPACAQCHKLIDPIGFGFEAYDQLGRYREVEEGNAIDTTGELVGFTEDRLSGPYDGALEFGDRVAPSDTVLSCLAHKWFTFSMGRADQAGDTCSLEGIVEQSASRGGSLKEVLIAVTTSDSFRFRAAHESDVPGATP